MVKFQELQSKYSPDDQRRILNTLNTAPLEQLLKLNISENRLHNLKKWQTERGLFQTFADILEVDGLGVKMLDKLCTSIISKQHETPPKSISKNRRQYIMPLLTKDTEHIKTAVGLHLGPIGISWSKLSKSYELENWSHSTFAEVPKKMLPTDTFNLVRTILKEIPHGDLYIFEAPAHIARLGNKQASLHNEYLELLSMLHALLSTSVKHNLRLTENDAPNCIYYLRPYLSARLFRTLMGTERVSSTPAVHNLFEMSNSADIKLHNPLKIDAKLKENYLSQTAVRRELLGQALLLIVTFMELCIHKNSQSLAIITKGKRNSNK